MAGTLTFKMGIQAGTSLTMITADHCRENLRHALNKLNRKLFGNRWQKHNRRVRVFPVLEQDAAGRYHYHILFDRPDHVTYEHFVLMISACWMSTPWGHREKAFEPTADDGWLRYITKGYWRPNFDENIDWENCHLD